MKRLLTIAAAMLVAALFVLPSAAIINLDGTTPEWDGDPGIMPLMETIDGLEVPVEETTDVVVRTHNSGVLYIGEPADDLDGDADTNLDGDLIEFDRSPFARDMAGADEWASTPYGADKPSAATLAIYIGLGAVSLAALGLAIAALVKVGKKK